MMYASAMYEQAILHKALERLENITSFQANLEPLSSDDKVDGLLRLSKNRKSQQFRIEIKRDLTSSITSFYNKQRNIPLLFVTRYVNDKLSKKLKQQKVNFIDTVGNAYIDTNSLFIYIAGNKPKKGINKTLPIDDVSETLENYYGSISSIDELSDILNKTYDPIPVFSMLSEMLETSYEPTLTSFSEQMNQVLGEIYKPVSFSLSKELDHAFEEIAYSISEQLNQVSGEAYKSVSLSKQLDQALGEAYKPVSRLSDELKSAYNNNAIPTISSLNKTLESGTYKPITVISQLNNKKIKKLTRLTPSKLKLIFVFLCQSKLLNKTYREIKKVSGVSTGTITKVMKELEEKNYLSKTKKNRKIQNKEPLIEQWISAYNEKLRPKLLMGYYKAVHKNWHETINLPNFNACWSGEVAADKLTNYLCPHFSSLYINGQPNKLILLNSLKSSAENEADVEILEKFWHFENKENPSLAPALLIYADLINSSDPRNIEVAKQIYNEYIN